MKKLKKLFIMLLIAIMASACTITFTSDSKKEEAASRYLKVYGIYKDKNTFKDNGGVERISLYLIYELRNTSDENWEDLFYWSDNNHLLSINDNDYKFDESQTSNYASSRAGYSVPTDVDEIWSDGKFLFCDRYNISVKDLKGEGTITLTYGDNDMNYSFDANKVKIYDESRANNIGADFVNK